MVTACLPPHAYLYLSVTGVPQMPPCTACCLLLQCLEFELLPRVGEARGGGGRIAADELVNPEEAFGW
jgi:hypothetical protein